MFAIVDAVRLLSDGLPLALVMVEIIGTQANNIGLTIRSASVAL